MPLPSAHWLSGPGATKFSPLPDFSRFSNVFRTAPAYTPLRAPRTDRQSGAAPGRREEYFPMLRRISVPSALSRHPRPLAAGLLLLLALAGAPPAHASLNTKQPITVASGQTLTLTNGDSVDT